MKRTLISLTIALSCISAHAQKFDYDVDFQYLFNNGSYQASRNIFEVTGTLNSAVLTPWLGLRVDQFGEISHSLMFGVDLRKDLGFKTPLDNSTEILFYYNLKAELGDGVFSSMLGSFPRSFSEGYYDNAFFSDIDLFNDRFYDGISLKYKSKKFYAELVADLMSAKQKTERFKFQALSAGTLTIWGPLSFGWSGRFHIFGESLDAPNSVLSAMANLYLKFSPRIGMDRFDITAGWIQTYQHDLAFGDVAMPGGAAVVLNLNKWGIGLDNNFYFGEDLMPFYSYSFNDYVYGSGLYPAKAFYHTKIDGFSFYDRAELYYSHDIASWINIKLAFDFHLGNPTSIIGFFRGWQQVLSVKFDLGALTPSGRKY